MFKIKPLADQVGWLEGDKSCLSQFVCLFVYQENQPPADHWDTRHPIIAMHWDTVMKLVYQELAAHQNTGRSSWTIYSPHNDKDTLAPPARIHWHPSTGSLVYQEIRQLLITIKAAAFQLQNLSSASKPFTVFINLTNVLKNLLLSMLR